MIVRNEEKMLPGCLQSLRSVADEIVVVDTGSVDGTVELLREAGAKVHHHPWENDFSKHRNQSLAYASGDWILQIDADERLHEESIDEVRRLVAESPVEVTNYLIEIHDCDPRGRRRNYFLFPRLFRNNAGASYEGEVHNQLHIGGTRARSGIRLDHLGYHLEPAVLQRKFERTRDLLLAQIERDNNDAFALLNLTLVHAMHKDVDGVIRFGERLANLIQGQSATKSQFFSFYHPLAAAHLSHQNYSRAEALASAVLKRVPDYPDGHHILAWLALVRKDHAKVLSQGATFQKSLQAWSARPPALDEIECHSLPRGCEVRSWMGVAQIALGEISSGLASLEAAFKDPAFDEYMALNLLRLIGELKPQMLMEWGPRCLQLFMDDLDYVFAALSILQQAAGITIMRYSLAVLDADDLPGEGNLYRRALLHLLREDYRRAADLLAGIGTEDSQFSDAQRQLRFCHERLSVGQRMIKPAPAISTSNAPVFMEQ
jgi:hypothetical protein